MKSLFLIDANSLIHRAYHALPPFTSPTGEPTGALYGLANILLKIIREDSPNYIAAFFDRPEPTFREEIFKEYKIQRPKAPDELISQLLEAHELFQKIGVRTYEAAGFEADDLIAEVVYKFGRESNLKIVILSGDLDTLQLVSGGKIVVKAFKKGVSETTIYDEAAVRKRYGITPRQMPDYKSLVGDTSDNIPGVKGIGPKTASGLIQRYGGLENFFRVGQSEKNYEKIFSSKDQIKLFKKLVTLKKDTPLEIRDLEELRYPGLSPAVLSPYLKKLGFKSLINRISGNKSGGKENKPLKSLFDKS
jgi:DNA polymerase-1